MLVGTRPWAKPVAAVARIVKREARIYPSIHRRARDRLAEMIVRAALLEDAMRIATIHVEAWQIAYRGIVPDEFLGALSVDQRVAVWRQNLQAKEPSTWVRKTRTWFLVGFRPRGVVTMTHLSQPARFGQCTWIEVIGIKALDARFLLSRKKNCAGEDSLI